MWSVGREEGRADHAHSPLAGLDRLALAVPEASASGTGTAATVPGSGFAVGSGMMALLMLAGVTVLARSSVTRW
jgi:hypothetical protein